MNRILSTGACCKQSCNNICEGGKKVGQSSYEEDLNLQLRSSLVFCRKITKNDIQAKMLKCLKS